MISTDAPSDKWADTNRPMLRHRQKGMRYLTVAGTTSLRNTDVVDRRALFALIKRLLPLYIRLAHFALSSPAKHTAANMMNAKTPLSPARDFVTFLDTSSDNSAAYSAAVVGAIVGGIVHVGFMSCFAKQASRAS